MGTKEEARMKTKGVEQGGGKKKKGNESGFRATGATLS